MSTCPAANAEHRKVRLNEAKSGTHPGFRVPLAVITVEVVEKVNAEGAR
jgi:hypothetical protein